MTTDLWMLAATSLFCMVLPNMYVLGRVKQPNGLEWGLGNRDTPFEAPAWVDRAERAHRNLLENLPVFAALVLIAEVSHHSNSLTAIGAVIFFIARLAHAAVYIMGITKLRTLCFAAGHVGGLIIFFQLF